ncbi:DNA polymerase III subunit delta [Aliiglaciecola sp. CAU 1673]|uniref:DNA polymerase III subunit delta n=1 Tax=Aliiglaciecola sp. CAU 1673 TaxID=3032595 RepID=UPI0023D9CD54|nr:DNA polymerase III subunit delta [Aliiglaciecola sp. CAU 1673]MDF2179339.1 DNA polymerase III subunit delta [Aliiglaciecola sp. CAU 1673]
MQVYPNRLVEQLRKGLQPFYLIFGDEPQQKLESISLLRQAAQQAGFDERHSLVVDSGFQWSQLLDACQSLSLFSARQMVELELPTGKPGAEGAKLLTSLAESPNPDVLLVIHGGRIGKDVQSGKWFKTLDKQGAYIPCAPLEGRALTTWVADRVRSSGLQSDPQLVKLLCDYCEGNLLAARQEIDKLALLFPGGQVGIEQAEKAMLDQSRFNVFQLVDVLLAGDADKAVKILYRLENEGVEPTVVCWALVREWQTLYALKFAQQQGTPLNSLWNQYRIWSSRQGLYQAALQRLSMQHLEQLQVKLSAFDQAIKQTAVPRPYVELCHLCLLFMPMDLAAMELDYL